MIKRRIRRSAEQRKRERENWQRGDSPLFESLTYDLNAVLPGPCTDADVVLKIAEILSLHVEGMPDVLKNVLYREGKAISGSAIGILNKMTAMHRNLYWTKDVKDGAVVLRFEVRELADRDQKIWAVIQRGLEGPQYCRELENAGVKPLRTGVWKDCQAGTYEAAYLLGEPWRHRIQDEKSKIRRKARDAGLASE